MITSLHVAGIVDLYASSLELDDLSYPLFKFGWTPELGESSFPKSNSSGSWATRSRVQSMTIECNGVILADTTSQFWTRRKALAAKIIPPPDDPPYPEYDHVRFIAQFDGDGNTYYADAVLRSNIGALEVTGAPTIQEFELMFECRAGYWTNGLGGPRVVI
jgi:hypothetical protein